MPQARSRHCGKRFNIAGVSVGKEGRKKNYLGSRAQGMEKKMETTIGYWGIYWGNIEVYIGIMEKKMETTVVDWGIYYFGKYPHPKP